MSAAREDFRGRGGAGERLACLSYAALRFGVETAVEGLRSDERDLRMVGVLVLATGVLGRVTGVFGRATGVLGLEMGVLGLVMGVLGLIGVLGRGRAAEGT